MKFLLSASFNEARKSSGVYLLAYILMPDHFHIITDSRIKPSEVLRYYKGISARRVIDYLKQNNFNSSLDKLKKETEKRKYQYSLWQHHSNTFSITSEEALMQKVNYIHKNPVTENLVFDAKDYHFSSARIWLNRRLEKEPLEVDIDKIKWRKPQL